MTNKHTELIKRLRGFIHTPREAQTLCLEAANALQSSESAAMPVDAVLLDDMVEGKHPQYGRGLFTTDNCVKKLYTQPASAKPLPLTDDVNALLHQIDIGDFVDSNGHSAKMLKPVQDLMKLLGEHHG